MEEFFFRYEIVNTDKQVIPTADVVMIGFANYSTNKEATAFVNEFPIYYIPEADRYRISNQGIIWFPIAANERDVTLWRIRWKKLRNGQSLTTPDERALYVWMKVKRQ